MAIDWRGLKAEFETGNFSTKELSGKYQCHPSTIRKKVAKQGWSKRVATNGAVSEGVEKTPLDLRSEHRRLWRDIKGKLAKGLEKADSKLGIEELKVAKLAVEVLFSIVKGERDAWGVAFEGYDDRADDTEGIAAQMACVTAPPRTDEGLERE